jgi:tRNA A58 N-methylase Trm61
VYDSTIREYLPKKWKLYNGVAVRKAYLFDSMDHNAEYEADYINALERQIRHGDDIVLVGGGLGVSTVCTSQATGAGGHVTVYEGSEDREKIIAETIRVNRTDAPITQHRAIVGKEVYVNGDSVDKVVRPDELPECDVLGLDCEGAEEMILEEMVCEPRNIVVEFHPNYDTTETSVSNCLEEAGYRVVDVSYEDDSDGIGHVVATRRKE